MLLVMMKLLDQASGAFGRGAAIIIMAALELVAALTPACGTHAALVAARLGGLEVQAAGVKLPGAGGHALTGLVPGHA